MATSRKEPHQPNASRTNRGVRNMSPVLKPRGEPADAQGILRRARSVPSSPDRRSSASAAASSSSSSSNACRPSSSFNPRSTASSRSSFTSGSSASASTHGKTPLLHSVSSMVGAKQAAGVMRRRADKSTAGATSVRPHTSPDKDAASKPAKSPSSNAQKSKLIPTRPGAEKTAAAAAAPSPKPRTQKATGVGAAGKTPPAAASSSARNIPGGATAKRRPAGTTETSAVPSIRRTSSVPVPAVPKAAHQEPDVDDQLLMEEFDETESISTPSIEEHLQQRLPDPVDVVVTAFTSTTSEPHVDAPTPSEEPFSSSREEQEHKNDQEAVITEHMTMVAEEKREHLNGGDDADVAKEAAAEVVDDDVELLKKEAAESNEAAIETGSVGKIELKGDVDDEPTTKSNEADGEQTELQQAVDGEAELKDHPELLTVKKEAEDEPNDERTVLPATKTVEAVQRMRTNEVTEEGGSRSKTAAQERRNKVMALVGRFETAMSGSDRE